jgi:hypothetical protein
MLNETLLQVDQKLVKNSLKMSTKFRWWNYFYKEREENQELLTIATSR